MDGVFHAFVRDVDGEEGEVSRKCVSGRLFVSVIKLTRVMHIMPVIRLYYPAQMNFPPNEQNKIETIIICTRRSIPIQSGSRRNSSFPNACVLNHNMIRANSNIAHSASAFIKFLLRGYMACTNKTALFIYFYWMRWPEVLSTSRCGAKFRQMWVCYICRFAAFSIQNCIVS